MVKFENVEIKYGNFVAMNNLNLDIKEGEFFTFLGPSGCGKTTSLRALVGFIKPSKEEFWWLERISRICRWRAGISEWYSRAMPCSPR